MLQAFTERLLGKSSHPLADTARAAKVIDELPQDNAVERLLEAAVLLESLEGEARLDPTHRVNVVAMIDEAAHEAVEELTLGYIGAISGMPAGRLQDWRTLSDFLEKLINSLNICYNLLSDMNLIM